MPASGPSWYDYGVFFVVEASGAWTLALGHRALASGAVAPPGGRWHRLSLEARGSQIEAALDGQRLVAATSDGRFQRGWCGLGTGWHGAEFRDWTMVRLPGSPGPQYV